MKEKRKHCTAIVLAAGRGSRMKSEVQKQFLLLEDKPLLYYSLKCFEDSPLITDIVLVTGKESRAYCREKVVEAYGFQKVRDIVAGGKERYDSVYSGLCACSDADYVFIHDSARPLITEELLTRGYETVVAEGACVAGVPAKDTIKVADEQGYVAHTPDRALTWVVQTPQIFSYSLVRGAYDLAMAGDPSGITDDAMVVERCSGHKVRLFYGDYRNIKVTTPEDLLLARAFLHR